MHGLQACLFKYITVAAFSIYALHGEDDTKRGGWSQCIIHGHYIIDHGKIMELCFMNFCGYPEVCTGSFVYCYVIVML